MTKAIKEYVEFTQIETFDGTINTPAKPEDLDKLIQNNKFILIGKKRIAVHQIKGYEPMTVHGIEAHIMGKTKDEQTILKRRLKEKESLLGRGRDSTKEIDNYLSNHK